jgi:putative MATE family efflux protein
VDAAVTSITPTSQPANVAPRPVAARTKLLLEGPILPTLLRLSAPNVLNLLALAGMITFDGLFVGRLGPEPLAGVSLAFPWVMLIQHTAASGMGGAVASAVARSIGAGRRDVADALAYHAFVLALALGAIFSTALLLGGPFVFRWMGGDGEVLSAAFAYSNVAFAGAVAICMLNLLASVVRGTGNMTFPAAVIVGSVLGHILISPVLIFGWGPLPALGPAGAGWGLVAGFAAGSIVLLYYLRSPRSLVALRFRGVPLQWKLFADILKVGVPGLINTAITNLSVVILTGIAGHLGTEAAIGYAMGARLEYILIPLAFGFGKAVSPCARDRVDRRCDGRAVLRGYRIDRRHLPEIVARSFQQRRRDRPAWRLVSSHRRPDLRLLWPRHGLLFRHAGIRAGRADRDRQRGSAVGERGGRPHRGVLARPRRSRLLRRRRGWIFHLCGPDHERGAHGQGAGPETVTNRRRYARHRMRPAV